MDFDKYNRGFENVGMKGHINFIHYRNGMPIEEIDVPNLVVTTGKAQVAGLFNGGVSQAFTALAIGTGTTTPAAADTDLAAQAGDRASATCSRVTTTTTNDTAQLVATFNFNAATAITEAGIFDLASSGTLAARATFSAINVASGDSLQLTHKVQYT
jgi:hypothetical protein